MATQDGPEDEEQLVKHKMPDDNGRHEELR
jgi:hypothetical protein